MLGCYKSEYSLVMKDVRHSKIAAWWDRAVDIIPANGGKGIAIKKLLEYYRLNPSKIPAIIYCLKADSFAAEHVSQFAKTYHYNLQETALGYVLVSSNLT